MTSLSILILCILLLILAVTVFKVHPIPALLICGLILGLSTGSPVEAVTESLLNGFGNTLKWIGLVVFFGAVLGEILAVTGGADTIADGIIKLFGPKQLPLSMVLIGFLIGIPVFVDVAYLTLLPTITGLSKRSGHSVLLLGLALASGLTVAHALIPPTPGPLAMAAILEVDIGSMIPVNGLVGLVALAGGLLWLSLNKKRLKISVATVDESGPLQKKSLKTYQKVLPFLSLLTPLFLMALGTLVPKGNALIQIISNPVWALMIGVGISLPLLEVAQLKKELNNYMNNAGSKSAVVILITGVGGAFGQVIKDSGIVTSLVSDTADLSAIGILLPFLLSFLFTTVTGSITVSLVTTASIAAPLVSGGMMDPTLTAAAIGAGSLGIIHVNSSFFWLFKEVHDLSVLKLLRTFSLLTAVVALSGGLMVLLLSLFK